MTGPGRYRNWRSIIARGTHALSSAIWRAEKRERNAHRCWKWMVNEIRAKLLLISASPRRQEIIRYFYGGREMRNVKEKR